MTKLKTHDDFEIFSYLVGELYVALLSRSHTRHERDRALRVRHRVPRIVLDEALDQHRLADAGRSDHGDQYGRRVVLGGRARHDRNVVLFVLNVGVALPRLFGSDRRVENEGLEVRGARAGG